MTDFSEVPFVAGSLTGLRSFKVTPTGVLTGCIRPQAWAQGVNEAKCLAWSMSAPIFRARDSAHRVGQLECSCGFYAYFDGDANPHHRPGNVLGLVEGFGTVTVGSRGFRASKARIQALIIGDVSASPLNQIVALYPDVPLFVTLDDALAEFPLTPVACPVSLRKRPPVRPAGLWTAIGASAAASAQSFADAMRELSRAVAVGTATIAKLRSDLAALGDETPQQRALRLKRERNTGPAPRRLDGRRAS